MSAKRIALPGANKGINVEFRLIYHGSLPAQPSDDRKPRTAEKHAIRRYLHPQLRELWRTVPVLSEWMNFENLGGIRRPNPGSSHADKLADSHVVGPFRFLPLITNRNGMTCALDILFLRRDGPGNLVTHGGDIDNRIKVLFDSLRKPTENNELCGTTPNSDENPFYCLLEDDKLITDISLTTDRLLSPMEAEEKIHDVMARHKSGGQSNRHKQSAVGVLGGINVQDRVSCYFKTRRDSHAWL